MKRLQIAIMAGALVLAVQARANTETISINFAGDDSRTIGSGTVIGNQVSGNLYEAVSGSFTISAGPAFTLETYTLIPNPNPPNQSTSPSGYFYFDNTVADGMTPFLDNNGLLFHNGTLELNLYWSGGNSVDGYVLYDNKGVNIGGSAYESAVGSVPDGGMTIALLGGALMGLAGLRRKLVC